MIATDTDFAAVYRVFRGVTAGLFWFLAAFSCGDDASGPTRDNPVFDIVLPQFEFDAGGTTNELEQSIAGSGLRAVWTVPVVCGSYSWTRITGTRFTRMLMKFCSVCGFSRS